MNEQSTDKELVARITAAVRAADQAFERSGGSSRHWVRECLLPELDRAGLAVVDTKANEGALTARLAPEMGLPPPGDMPYTVEDLVKRAGWLRVSAAIATRVPADRVREVEAFIAKMEPRAEPPAMPPVAP
jgi:hypothetical protein